MSTHDDNQQLQFSGLVLVGCVNPDCIAACAVEVKEWEVLADLPTIARELAEELHGWHLGRFCERCSPAAKAEDRGDYEHHAAEDRELCEA